MCICACARVYVYASPPRFVVLMGTLCEAVNGNTYLESMTLHPWLRDAEGAVPKRYSSTNARKLEACLFHTISKTVARRPAELGGGHSS